MTKKTIGQEIKEAQKQRRKEQFANSGLVLTVKGLWTFAEGAALLITSVYAIYQAWTQNYAVLWQDVLLASGALVLVPAAILLSKFFRAVGKA